jgi:hypothetical protein
VKRERLSQRQIIEHFGVFDEGLLVRRRWLGWGKTQRRGRKFQPRGNKTWDWYAGEAAQKASEQMLLGGEPDKHWWHPQTEYPEGISYRSGRQIWHCVTGGTSAVEPPASGWPGFPASVADGTVMWEVTQP